MLLQLYQLCKSGQLNSRGVYRESLEDDPGSGRPATATTFARIRMRVSIPRDSNHCNTDGRSVWTAGETMLKNEPHLVQFDHCIIVSIYTERQKKLITSSE